MIKWLYCGQRQSFTICLIKFGRKSSKEREVYLLSLDSPLPACQKVAKFVQHGEPFRRERGSITPLILSLSCSRLTPDILQAEKWSRAYLEHAPSLSRVLPNGLSKGQKLSKLSKNSFARPPHSFKNILTSIII